MHEVSVKKLLVPSFVIVILSTVFFYEFNYGIDIPCFKKRNTLIIGILSAPENFNQRLSIRKTWLQLLPSIRGTAYFIIGKKICGVPQVDRADPYSCIDKPFFLPPDTTTETEFVTSKVQSKNESKFERPHSIGFGFYVRQRILVKKLGVFKELLNLFHIIQVKLISAFDNKVLASVTFDVEMLNETCEQVLTKPIKPVLLIENDEAFVRLEARNIDKLYPSCNYISWDNEPGVINFIYLLQEDSVIPHSYTEEACTFVFMSYSIIDIGTIKNQINNRNSRLKNWQEANKDLFIKLMNESTTYNDLMFVDVVDVYRNLSLKMVHFYKRILESENFQYILKADDDSFLDLFRVHNQLEEIDNAISKSPRFFWWAKFREFWKVQRSGKWRDVQYQSAMYPTFPCGGGYVVSKGIVEFIVSNENKFNYFQGEDVSMGIWLSSLFVTQYKIPKSVILTSSNHLQEKIITKFKGRQFYENFKGTGEIKELAPNTCQWTCNNEKYYNLPFCNKVQLSIKDMYNIWLEYIKNGFL